MPKRIRKKTDTVVKKANLSSLLEPQYLSLVGSPSNRTGFKVIRSEDDATSGQQKTKMVSLRAKNADRIKAALQQKKRTTNGLISIAFPEGIMEEQAVELMEMFRLGDEFDLVQGDDGSFTLTRLGDTSVPYIPVNLGHGLIAHLEQSVFDGTQRGDCGVTLVELQFHDSHFESVGQVRDWLEARDIDFQDGGVEQVEGGVVVTRHDAKSSDNTRKIQVADGVTAIVQKSDETDVPLKVYRNVVEQSYGNWGWGHLDFSAALADPEFTDKSWDAIYTLRDVLETIIFYSGLPLAERQQLIERACEQFANFFNALIENLPTDVIEQAKTSDTESTKEKLTMIDTHSKAKQTEEKRSDEGTEKTEKMETKTETASTAETETKETQAQNADQGGAAKTEQTTEKAGDPPSSKIVEGEKGTNESDPVTRADVASMVKEEVAAAIKPVTEQMKTLGDTLQTVAETMKTVTESVTEMKGKVEDFDTATITRSDVGDGEVAQETKAKKNDVFTGCLGTMGGLRQ